MPQFAVTVEYTIVYTGCITLRAKTQDIARERIAARLVAVVNSTQFQALLDGEMDVQEALEITDISEA